jgi:hypothetical protein
LPSEKVKVVDVAKLVGRTTQPMSPVPVGSLPTVYTLPVERMTKWRAPNDWPFESPSPPVMPPDPSAIKLVTVEVGAGPLQPWMRKT